MKKFGILIFVIAVVGGIVLAKMFSFGSLPALQMPSVSFFSKVKGSGNVVTERRNVTGFTKVDVGGAFQVDVVKGDEFAVEVEADDNLLPLISTKVRNGTLNIDTEERFSTRNGLKVRITAPNIESMDVSGASSATLANVDNEELALDISGASRLKVSGNTISLTIDMGGASKVDASELKASKVTVDGGGASRADVNVTDELKVDLGGASKVTYRGNPSDIEKSTSGASSVKQN